MHTKIKEDYGTHKKERWFGSILKGKTGLVNIQNKIKLWNIQKGDS
jgi:hypothetical protein